MSIYYTCPRACQHFHKQSEVKYHCFELILSNHHTRLLIATILFWTSYHGTRVNRSRPISWVYADGKLPASFKYTLMAGTKAAKASPTPAATGHSSAFLVPLPGRSATDDRARLDVRARHILSSPVTWNYILVPIAVAASYRSSVNWAQPSCQWNILICKKTGMWDIVFGLQCTRVRYDQRLLSVRYVTSFGISQLLTSNTGQ